jgi:secreted trypsin-like serine protease
VRSLRLIVSTLAAALLASAPAAAAPAPPRTPAPTARIVGGHAPTRTWPAQTSVEFKIGSSWYVCGGTLMSARWVLTAAHCATDNGGAVLAPSAFKLHVGGTTRSSGNASDVDQVVRNPSYNDVTYSNDLALLHLTTAAPQEPMRIVAAGNTEASLWGAGVEATAIGWGITNPADAASQSSSLVEAQVPMIGDSACTSAWGANFKVASMVCAGGASIDTCGGDSGGPLMVPRDGAFTIVGVTSWGYDPCAQPGYPGVYARLAAPTLNSWLRASVPMSEIAVSASTPAPGAQVSLAATVAAGAHATAPTSLSWDLNDDGAFDDATGDHTTVTFATAGSHVVHFQALYDDLDRSVARAVVTVNGPITPVTPPPPAPPAPVQQVQQPVQQQNTERPIGSVSAPTRVKLRTLRDKGLRVRYRCEQACTISGRLKLDSATARRFGLKKGTTAVTIGRGSGSRVAAGSGTVDVRLTARAKRALRKRGRFTVRLATELGGAATPLQGLSRITVSR